MEEDLSPGRRPEAHVPAHGPCTPTPVRLPLGVAPCPGSTAGVCLSPPCRPGRLRRRARRSRIRAAPRHLARTMPTTLSRLR